MVGRMTVRVKGISAARSRPPIRPLGPASLKTGHYSLRIQPGSAERAGGMLDVSGVQINPNGEQLRAGQSEDWPLQCEFGDGEPGSAEHAGGMLDVSGV